MIKTTTKMGMRETNKETKRKIGNKKGKNKIAEGIKKEMETTKSTDRKIDLMNNKTQKKWKCNNYKTKINDTTQVNHKIKKAKEARRFRREEWRGENRLYEPSKLK